MPDKTYFKSMFIFIIFYAIFLIFKIVSLVKKIYTMKKSAKTSTAFCSIIQVNKEELTQNIISLILAIFSILLFNFSRHVMQEYLRTGFYPVNYQKYILRIYLIQPVIYLFSVIGSIVTLSDCLFPTIITNNFINVNCSIKYNKDDVAFKKEGDKILIFHSQRKDTIVCIDIWRKKKESILEILKMYYNEDINCDKHSAFGTLPPQSELFDE